MNFAKQIFIGGCSRSGTTFLGALLGANEKCLCTPESQFKIDILKDIDADGLFYNNQILYSSIKNNFRFKIWGIDLFLKDFERTTYTSFFNNILERYAGVNSLELRDIWVDHTPLNLRYTDMLMTCFPEAKFIHIIRDGRAIAASSKKLRWGISSPIRLADIWMKELAFGFAAESILPKDKIIQVKYENLVLETEQELKRICEFIGIDFSLEMLSGKGFKLPDYTKNQHQLVGEPAQKDRIEKWKAELSERDIEIFEYYAGRMLSMLDYKLINKQPREPLLIERIKLKVLDHRKRMQDNSFLKNQKRKVSI